MTMINAHHSIPVKYKCDECECEGVAKSAAAAFDVHKDSGDCNHFGLRLTTITKEEYEELKDEKAV